jgi:cytochrome c biogenesis protein CcmG, thiol:disulfide interchange protein DsbE
VVPGKLLVGATAVAALVVAIIASGTRNPEDTARPAPELPTQVLLPPRVPVAALRGEPAAINFWASWCGPCHKEAPELARLPAELDGRARLVAVDWSDDAGDARSFINRYHWRFPVLRDGNGTVGNRYGLSGLPTTFILDRRGRIIRELHGPQTAAGIKRELAAVPG